MHNVVDIIALSREHQRLSGVLSLTALPRVIELVGGAPDGDLRYWFDFTLNACGEPLISGAIDTTLRLQCQRCLAGMEWSLQAAVHVIVVDSAASEGKHAAAQSTEVWWVDNRHNAALQELIADEIILALPFAPRHAGADCQVPPLTGEVPHSATPVDRQHATPSPFAVLAQLRRK